MFFSICVAVPLIEKLKSAMQATGLANYTKHIYWAFGFLERIIEKKFEQKITLRFYLQ